MEPPSASLKNTKDTTFPPFPAETIAFDVASSKYCFTHGLSRRWRSFSKY